LSNQPRLKNQPRLRLQLKLLTMPLPNEELKRNWKSIYEKAHPI
jgi:hypothetical protein